MTTPPQGQNPFAQQPAGAPQPGGQPPYPQGAYGQTPPGQPVPGGFPGGVPMAPPPQPRSKFSAKNVIRGIIVVVVLALAIGGWIASRDDADTAKVGDCVVNSGSDFKPDVEVVDCSSAKAEYKVIEKHDGKASCDRTKYSEYSETKGSDVLFTLCLKAYQS